MTWALQRQGSMDGPQRKYPVSVTVAHQNTRCLSYARRAVRAIEAYLGEEAFVFQTAWRFDLLQLPPMRKRAVRNALTADLIVICASEIQSVEQGFYDWLAEWPARRRVGPAAIMLVLAGQLEPGQPNPFRIKMREVCERYGMDYFSAWTDLKRSDYGK